MKWNDGTPKSTGNAFNWRTKESSIALQDKTWVKSEQTKPTSTKTVAKARKAGKEPANLSGLSKKSDAILFDFKAARQYFNVHIASQEESDRTRAIRNS